MKKVKTVEFLYLTWILIGLLHFCCVHSSETKSESHDEPNLGLVSTVINKCDPDSKLNGSSELDVEQFNKAFGYGAENRTLNFTFKNSFSGFNGRCTVQTLYFQLNSTSESGKNSTAESGQNSTSAAGTNSTSKLETNSTLISKANLTSVSTVENENEIIRVKSEFGEHGFFNYEPNFFINPENYCVKNMNVTFLTVELREPASTSNSDSSGSKFPPTIQKCCDVDERLMLGDSESGEDPCEISKNPPWKPKFMEKDKIFPNYNSRLPCEKMINILPLELSPKIKRDENSSIVFKDVRVLENGQVETRESGNHQWKKLEQNDYCIDGFHEQLTGNKSTEEETAYDFMVRQCAPPEFESGDTILAVSCFISSFVLSIIAIVYVLICNQQNIHEWTKCAFSLALFLWYLCTGVRILYKKDGEKEDDFCVFIAVTTHFFHISIYSWMLLLNFDLWSTISSMRAPNQRSTERKRFLFFCCFALIIPTIVVSISLIIENQFSLFDDSVIRPQYGRERCSLDNTAVNAYVIYPSLILFLPNFLFIFWTIKIYVDFENGGRITAAQNNKRIELQFCIKLFLLMGIFWIFDIISGQSETDTDEVSWVWFFTYVHNSAQPFFLFWLFVCQRRIQKQLAEKYPLFKVAGLGRREVNLPGPFSASDTVAVSGSETQPASYNSTSDSLQ